MRLCWGDLFLTSMLKIFGRVMAMGGNDVVVTEGFLIGIFGGSVLYVVLIEISLVHVPVTNWRIQNRRFVRASCRNLMVSSRLE